MNIINQWVSPELMEALGWALIHSLWQGAGVALLLGVLFLFMQKNSAQFRYNLSLAGLVVVFGLFLATFYRFYLVELAETQTLNLLENSQLEVVINQAVHNIQSNSFVETFTAYFNQYLPLIVTIWLLGMLAFSLRLLGGMAHIQRLKYHQHYPISAYWNNEIQTLKQSLQITLPVRLVESALVQVPLVIGYLKPIVLLPIGTINGLNEAEVSAILAHELAHIKRQDYLINLFQSVIEIIFFYHPAVWWISSKVRAERENCCDDIAIEVTGNSIIYAKALANLALFKIQKPLLTMAATSKKGQLLQRIQRLLQQPRTSSTTSEIVAFIGVLLICLFATTLVAQSKVWEETETPEPIPPIEAIVPTPPSVPAPPSSPEQVIRFDDVAPLNKVFPSEMQEAPIAPVFPVAPLPKKLMDKKTGLLPVAPIAPISKLSAPDFPNLPQDLKIGIRVDTSILGEKALREISLIHDIEEDGVQKEVKIQVNQKDGKQTVTVYENGQKLSEAEQQKHQGLIEQATNMMHNRNTHHSIHNRHKLQLAKSKELREKSLLKMEKHLLKSKQRLEQQQGLMEKRAFALEERQKNNQLRLLERSKKLEAGMKQREHFLKKKQEWINAFKVELAKDEIIKSKSKKLKIKLNENGFWVNGKKQSATVEQKYRAIYQATTGQDSRDISIRLRMTGEDKFRIEKSDKEETKKLEKF